MSRETVGFEETRELMNQMMKIPIFRMSELRQMIDDVTPINPNLVMDARHKILRQSLPISTRTSKVFSKGESSLTDEEIKELHWKREQAFLERELKKFEKELSDLWPKFQGSSIYECGRKSSVCPDEKKFWTTRARVKANVNNKISTSATRTTPVNELPFGDESMLPLNNLKVTVPEEIIEDLHVDDTDECCTNGIKVTIKDKTISETKEDHLEVLNLCFEALRGYAKEKRRLRDAKIKIIKAVSLRILRECLRKWKTHVDNSKRNKKQENPDNEDSLPQNKIEELVNNIVEEQKVLTKVHKSLSIESLPVEDRVKTFEMDKRNERGRYNVRNCPTSCRLVAQKSIIEKQRAKLAEQDRIINELCLKHVQNDLSKANKETINIAKESLIHCGQRTKRTLIQLMRRTGYREQTIESRRLPTPPAFLARMENRALARRERMKTAEETRSKKLEEQRRKEEDAKREEEQEKRRLQQEAIRKAQKLREEQEQYRTQQAKRLNALNTMADEFYRKYLIRRYLLKPLSQLVQTKNDNLKNANEYYKVCLIRKIFTTWNIETTRQLTIKMELATSLYRRNLLWLTFSTWKRLFKESVQKDQVATDFYDMKLQEKGFKSFRKITLRLKAKRLEDEAFAQEHYEEKLKAKSFERWRRYPELAQELLKSEKIKSEWREIVQEIVPDFNPEIRGVLLD